jgi:hypothetical protein
MTNAAIVGPKAPSPVIGKAYGAGSVLVAHANAIGKSSAQVIAQAIPKNQ